MFRKIFSRSKKPKEEEYGPAITRGCNLAMLQRKYPNLTTTEMCGNCGEEVEIPAYFASQCPVCGKRILPCSMCDLNDTSCDDCPFEGNRKRSKVKPQRSYNAKTESGGIDDAICFYEVGFSGGMKVAKLGIDFYIEDPYDEEYGWRIESSEAFVVPSEFAKNGRAAIPPEFDEEKYLEDLSRKDAENLFAHYMRVHKYLPIQNINKMTPCGKYYFRYDEEPYKE